MHDADRSGADQEFGSQMLEAALQTAVGAIVIIDDGGLIRTVNPASEKLFGFSESELIGQNVNLLMPEPYPQPARRLHPPSPGDRRAQDHRHRPAGDGAAQEGRDLPHASVGQRVRGGRPALFHRHRARPVGSARHRRAARAGAVPGDLQPPARRGARGRCRQQDHALQPCRRARVRLRARGDDRPGRPILYDSSGRIRAHSERWRCACASRRCSSP